MMLSEFLSPTAVMSSLKYMLLLSVSTRRHYPGMPALTGGLRIIIASLTLRYIVQCYDYSQIKYIKIPKTW